MFWGLLQALFLLVAYDNTGYLIPVDPVPADPDPNLNPGRLHWQVKLDKDFWGLFAGDLDGVSVGGSDCKCHLTPPIHNTRCAQPCSSKGMVTMKASRVIRACLVVILRLHQFRIVVNIADDFACRLSANIANISVSSRLFVVAQKPSVRIIPLYETHPA